MQPVTGISQVFDVIQRVKAEAPAFCTNFFPDRRKLEPWINRGELLVETQKGAAFFFRKDRDFQRLYFCAADAASFRQALAARPDFKLEPVVIDLVGNRDGLDELLAPLEAVGFRRYARLQRMAQKGPREEPQPVAGEGQVVFAAPADSRAILNLIESSFDRYAEQLPALDEIEGAVQNHQILVIKREGTIGGLLFYETQGVTSMVRYWLVAEPFRALHLGSGLMRHYLATQRAVRRFVLWVVADNAGAIQKYQHYGFLPDGLVDYVLASEMIRP
jgi:hypothetical protein